ncbi:MAG: hypothetical protein KA112_00080 [Alphaproteobacteria bacterium]|jgi:hypothetical protein|nr:hypothetical protein [Alphaproteobacteria bacterium]MBP7729000.1 hypothetical protein [Alphaproteobacteria bacterium]
MVKVLFVVMSVLVVMNTLSVSMDSAYADRDAKGYFLNHDRGCSFGDEKACIPRMP